jgi:hypothetical protein
MVRFEDMVLYEGNPRGVLALTLGRQTGAFRGALLREPGIHNPDTLHIIPTWIPGSRASFENLRSPRPEMTDTNV